jgi:inner membrane protein
MVEKYTSPGIAARLWFHSWITFGVGCFVLALFENANEAVFLFLVCAVCACIGSLPALVILFLSISSVRDKNTSTSNKFFAILVILLLICVVYGFALWRINFSGDVLQTLFPATGVLFSCNIVAVIINRKRLRDYFNHEVVYDPCSQEYRDAITHQNQNNIHMENDQPLQQLATPETNKTSNKVLIKGAITGALILIMLIPTLFITNLVEEREERQKDVVAEVSNKWAKAQTITGPYITVPYNETFVGKDNKTVTTRKTIVLLPEDLNVSGTLSPQERKRSIYTVLLYRTNLQANGKFSVKVPTDINAANLLLTEAKLCIGVNDFKGIEEKVTANFNGIAYDLTPGLPTDQVDQTGLSCSIPLTAEDFTKALPFNLNLKLKGSQQLSFVPLSGNSTFAINSTWASPSFDGSSLPSERQVSDSGFSAKWSFNKANLPFNTFLKDFKLDKASYAFGVSMVQPADQYAKTTRSVKYAILFIGLTFSLFFIVELMQKRPVHPVQYVLVGLALVIFYTLLLSISEFVLFDSAYLIAATATILLITLYAKGHFESWKVAGVFATVLGMLYSFIFVLIRLEDTALLVGSIGLFAVLALVMYASRRINWYNPTFGKTVIETA